MGEPKFSRPRTQTPTHPWKQARIDEEHDLKERYGLKKVGGMREIWREKSALRRHRNQAMKLIGRVDSTEGHYAKEKEQLLNSLTKKGLLQTGADVGDVLEINVEHMLSRRLQSVVYYKGLAPSMRAARNLIVHGHICIGDQRMTVPGYHVLKEEEDSLQYSENSPFVDPEHPFRKELETLRYQEDDEEELEEDSAEEEES
ncbi:MAG TPA: 30S ribosomal protein S4 [Candidatus Poseidoniales archaeon]|jgi:small subunit ribosomal protein S4|nr:30S ribosomal protein S4 [Euryarchaeota archaeon]MCH2640344.1 30S ribosomal protein S4 [Candidatus Thalassarchaeum sp.]GIS29422.1 MAG: 30S ribosomal protein S4 [Euryarchaeota archaeon]DAC11202.1 MAG TPA: 30S ribosomal protein S4 [Candidatus Poseidoniales archaeon]HIH67667.1 30S ribosomal protein S4 [Candidatus Thalassarchaeaceae archaeon]|tara:strand:- start:348 stop:950 length:603 start_codon:yes stop_codon:yes gene_type:complete